MIVGDGPSGGEGGDLLRYLLVCVFRLGLRDHRETFLGEVAARDEPLVILFEQQRAGEADERGVVGEDADDVGAAGDLAVDALERVCARAGLCSSASTSARAERRRRPV